MVFILAHIDVNTPIKSFVLFETSMIPFLSFSNKVLLLKE